MKFKFLLALVSLIFIYSFSTVNNTNSHVESQQSLLWKIEGKGIKEASFLFGTMHMIQKDFFYFPSDIEKLIKKSDVVVTEIPLDKIGDQQELLKHLILKDKGLMDFFNPAQQDSLANWAKSRLALEKEAFVGAFGKFKPMVIVQTVLQLSFMGKTESYEMSIKTIADKNKIALLGFESLAEQVAFFDNLPTEKQAEMVMESVRDEKKSVALLTKMQGIYKRQQIDSLYHLMQEEGGVLAAEQATFIDKRNQRWIPQINEILKTKKAFIAVGAGHLAGENGVISLLRKEGYILTPIRY